MKILIFRGGALGDFLVTVPALRLLRERWPDGRLELAGNAAAGALGIQAALLDAVHSQHAARWAPLFQTGPLPPDLAAWLDGFDLVVNFWPDPDGTLARHFPLRTGQQFLTAPALPVLAPAARHFCEPLRVLGMESTDFRSHLSLGAPRSPEAIGAVAVHPGSGSPRKNWPAERWLALIERLADPVLVVLGEAEREFPRSRLQQLRPPRAGNISVLDGAPLPELAARLARCRLFLGHDSGVSHLAAAVGVPCVLLFGPTDPAMWAPPGDHVRVIRRGESMDAISVDDVVSALQPG